MRFATNENVVDQKAAALLKSLRSIKIVYTNKNIFIKALFMDKEFEVLRGALQDKWTTLNTTADDKHVPQIKRQIKMEKGTIPEYMELVNLQKNSK